MSPPTVGIALQGDPSAASAWSGVPSGIATGLEGLGARVHYLRAESRVARRAADKLGRSVAANSSDPVLAAVSGAALRRQLRSAGPLDGVIQIGSGYLPPRGHRVVSFEDMTVAQAFTMPDPNYTELRPRAARRWHDRQRRLYERVTACCVASHWAADSLERDYGVPRARVHVIGFGPNVDMEPVEREWSPPRFLFVGREWERKNGPAVVDAFDAVREAFADAELHLVGGHPKIGREGVIEHGFLGLGSMKASYTDLLRSCTCLVMPSLYEPFGIAYLDAGHAGIASIGTTRGGAAEVIGNAGRVVEPSDRESLRRAMLELAEPATAERLGAAARARTDLFTWSAVAGRLLRALGATEGLDADRIADYLD